MDGKKAGERPGGTKWKGLRSTLKRWQRNINMNEKRNQWGWGERSSHSVSLWQRKTLMWEHTSFAWRTKWMSVRLHEIKLKGAHATVSLKIQKCDGKHWRVLNRDENWFLLKRSIWLQWCGKLREQEDQLTIQALYNYLDKGGLAEVMKDIQLTLEQQRHYGWPKPTQSEVCT